MRSISLKTIASLLMMAGAVCLPAAELVRERTPVARIVLADKPTRVAQFAAAELAYHVKLLTGAELPVIAWSAAQSSEATETTVYVGASPATAEIPSFLSQEYLVKVAGNRIWLLGCDEPDDSAFDYAKPSTFPDSWKEQGTAYAVYDFLEQLGVRWYLPTDLGVAGPYGSSLSAADLERRRRPTLEMRNMFPMNIPADLCGDTIRSADSRKKLNEREAKLWYLRRRHGGHRVVINHSFYTWYGRFWPSHPEYFAQGYHDGRPTQLCYTNPATIAQVIQDARDFFDGRKPAHQLVSNVPHGFQSDVFPVFPMDNRAFCHCENCRRLLSSRPSRGIGQFSNDLSSEYMFWFVNEVAKEVKKTHPGKYIGAGGYAGFAYPHKKLELEDNIMVMLCLHTRSNNPLVQDNNHAILDAWQKRFPKMKKYIWEYWCFPTLTATQQQTRLFPSFFASRVGELFADYRQHGMTGMFWEPSYLPEGQHSVLFDQVEGHVNWSLAWDESRDPARLLEEFFPLYYGPAATPMREWYRMAEAIYAQPVTWRAQTDDIAWNELGTAPRMKQLGELVEQARKLAVGEPWQSRFAVFDRGVWQYMVKGKARNEELDALRAPSMQQCAIPFVRSQKPGDPQGVDWKKSGHLWMYGGLRAEKCALKLDVRLAHDGEWLYCTAVEEQCDPSKLRENNLVWLNDEWEFFFAPTRGVPFHQIGIDVAGKHAAVIDEGTATTPWQFPGTIHKNRGDSWWSISFAVRLEDLQPGLKPGMMFYGNVIRSSNTQAKGVWVPTFSGYKNPSRFGEFFLMKE